MKFTAKALDLDLELTTLKGKEVFLDGPKMLNANQAAEAIEKINRQDDDIRKDNTPAGALQVAAKCLSDIYGKDPEWWKSEFDYSTLVEIRRYFLNTLAGIKKKE